MKSSYKIPTWAKLCLFLLTWFVFLIIFEIISQIWVSQEAKEVRGVASLAPRSFSRFMQLLGTLVSVWVFTRFVDKTTLVSIGLHIKKRTTDMIFGILLGFIIMAIGFLLLLRLDEIFVDAYVINTKGIILSMIFFVLVSFIEELLCRGYILGELLKTNHKYVALGISSILFTALHSFNPNMAFVPTLNLFLAGILLGITYIYTKNLWFPIALHFSWNFFQGPIFGFEVSGQEFYSVIRQTRLENNLINGGNFGFEGSLLATILMIIAIVSIDRFYALKAKKHTLLS